jgi:glycosyltransferase involved in cell wall biosynthesis
VELRVVYEAASAPNRRWRTHPEEMAYDHRALTQLARFRWGDAYSFVSFGVSRHIRDFRPDVIVAGGWDQPAHLEALFLRAVFGYRFLWWIESTARDLRREGPLIRQAKRRLVPAADGVIVAGSAAREYALQLGSRRGTTFVAPNAVDVEFFETRSRRDGRGRGSVTRFLFVGRLEANKGMLYLLDAWARVRGPAELAIVGTGSLEGRIRERITGSGASVELLGHLDREALAAEYARADVFVFPSVSDPWALVLNEAMASGLPIVTSAAPGAVDDLVRDGWNGFVVPPADAGALANAIQRVADDEDLRASMGHGSRERIHEFMPEACAAGIRDAARRVGG